MAEGYEGQAVRGLRLLLSYHHHLVLAFVNTLARQMADSVLITVTLSPASALYSSPDGLLVHPLLTRVGRVGELQDVQALSVPRESWFEAQGEVITALNALSGVLRVDVQDPPRTKVKRRADEL